MKKIIWNHAGEILSVIVALVLVLGMAGSVAAATRSNPQAPTDAAQYQVWLTQQVHHKLAMIPWYSVFDNLEYKVEGGKVILAGQVTRPVIKSDAESSVKGIEGVKEVVDEIEILPTFADGRTASAAGVSVDLFLRPAGALQHGSEPGHTYHREERPGNTGRRGGQPAG